MEGSADMTAGAYRMAPCASLFRARALWVSHGGHGGAGVYSLEEMPSEAWLESTK
jgi:hypothetical protein